MHCWRFVGIAAGATTTATTRSLANGHHPILELVQPSDLKWQEACEVQTQEDGRSNNDQAKECTNHDSSYIILPPSPAIP
mmetsp:Transcript_17570/g.27371  ORF Transcript_17570/g.27371 Transcript_17570/m.27371 type:complete len:80 (-) Transcript_17570:298-537(-)